MKHCRENFCHRFSFEELYTGYSRTPSYLKGRMRYPTICRKRGYDIFCKNGDLQKECLIFLLSSVQSRCGYTFIISSTWTERKLKLIAVSFLCWLLSLFNNVSFRTVSTVWEQPFWVNLRFQFSNGISKVWKGGMSERRGSDPSAHCTGWIRKQLCCLTNFPSPVGQYFSQRYWK